MKAATTSPAAETTLYMKRRFRATREQVFQAWTGPEKLGRWFAASSDHACSSSEVDLRVGGIFRLTMKHVPSGKDHVATGTYEEIRFPDRLVFSWSWEGKPENGRSRIIIELRDLDGETEMRFTQELFPNKEVRNDHERGWMGCFEKLERLLTV